MQDQNDKAYTEEYLRSIFSESSKYFRSYASRKEKRVRASEDLRKAIEESLKRIPVVQSKIIMLRFWENYSITEISRRIHRSWDETQELYEAALKSLKHFILNGGAFYNEKANFSKTTSRKVA